MNFENFLSKFQMNTLNLQDSTKWKTKTSPSTSLCAMENPLHPPLRPTLSTRNFVSNFSPLSSSRMIILSCFGKWLLQNCLERPYNPKCWHIKIRLGGKKSICPAQNWIKWLAYQPKSSSNMWWKHTLNHWREFTW